jgi:type II secretion system protein H
MSNIQPSRASHGFTLLEMALVLFILAVIAALAIPAASGLVARERLKSEAKALQDYAVSARRLAVTEGRPYEIILDARGFWLGPFVEDGVKKQDAMGSVQLPANVAYTVQRWDADGFGKPREESWVFQPDGICEPIRVHFQSGDGWIEYSFNPLTAGPRDEEEHFR